VTCSTWLSMSTRDNRSPHASDTRKPCRNISHSKPRSRVSWRVPLVAAHSFSTSADMRCLRSA
jgi:hypothetical protein